jgi:hypothetical protein
MEPPMLSSTMVRAPVRLMAMIRRCRWDRAQTGQANQIGQADANRQYLHPFKPGTSLNIGHWQTDVVNGATQMLRYTL